VSHRDVKPDKPPAENAADALMAIFGLYRVKADTNRWPVNRKAVGKRPASHGIRPARES
jgi:hypothetical protein